MSFSFFGISPEEALALVTGDMGPLCLDVASDLREEMFGRLTEKQYPPSSVAGDSPAERIGWLAESVEQNAEDYQDGDLHVLASVAVRAEYGRPLEFGFLNALTGYWVPARPFAVPSAQAIADQRGIEFRLA